MQGADTVIQERLSSEGKAFWRDTQGHLEEFGRHGLRTLCLACRDIGEAEYQAWAAKHEEAKASLVNRASLVDAAAEQIEVNLVLLGATAIEDKLQEGVGDCIEKLAEAGVKLWVLTGDKMETAINIGYACRVLNNSQRQCVISSEVPEVMAAEEKPFAEQDRILRNQVKLQLAEAQRRTLGAKLSSPPQKVALVMDGKVLGILLEKRHKQKLLALGIQCSAVICCRVSPLQKSQITRLVKEGGGQVTLAIGDGANDVSMIQAAHVGVGISGQEGLQAVMAADFALAQFRFLSDLLLVHGRWSYKRISKVIGYFFYKNTVFTLVQFWFNLYAAYSGQRFYDDWLQAFYNLLFTSLPVIALGLLDQDVSKESARRLPQLYREGQRNASFTVWVLLGWLLSALWQSVVVFYISAWTFKDASDKSGILLGMWSSGTFAYTLIATVVNLRLLLSVCYHTVWHYIVVFGSIIFYYVFLAIYSALPPGALNGVGKSDNAYFVIFELTARPSFWLAMVLGIGAALLPDVAWQGLRRAYFPSDANIIQEAEAAAKKTAAQDPLSDLRSSPNNQNEEVSISPHGLVTFGLDPELGPEQAPLSRSIEEEVGLQRQSSKQPKGIRFAEEEALAGSITDPTVGTEGDLAMKLPRRHTGYAFDHPGFESFHANEAEQKMIRDRFNAVRACATDPETALTPHQAAILKKKVALVKRYSATEALQIHAAAAAAELSKRSSSLNQMAGSRLSTAECQTEMHEGRKEAAIITFEETSISKRSRQFSIQSNPNPDTEDMLP